MAVATFDRSPKAGARIPQSLVSLLAELDRWSDKIPLDVLSKIVHRLPVSRQDLRDFVKFNRTGYARNRIRLGKAYEMFALCWRSGQRSPIHDHKGSACVFRVVEGIATETIFHKSDCGLVFPVRSDRHSVGEIRGSFDADIHQMGNLQQPGSDLVTLHIYSPPLRGMGTYFLGDSVVGEYDDLMQAATALQNSGTARRRSATPRPSLKSRPKSAVRVRRR